MGKCCELTDVVEWTTRGVLDAHGMYQCMERVQLRTVYTVENPIRRQQPGPPAQNTCCSYLRLVAFI